MRGPVRGRVCDHISRRLMTKIDVEKVPVVKGSPYPAPHDVPCGLRENRRIALAAGLTQFGVNLTTLKPGTWSSQRHWHRNEDEFIYVLEGEVVLVEGHHSETVLRPGDAGDGKADVGVGHCLINRGDRDPVYIEDGTRRANFTVVYSDIDMR